MSFHHADTFANFIEEVNREYMLHIQILDIYQEDEFLMIVTTNITQARLIFMGILHSIMREAELYDPNIVPMIRELYEIPSEQVFDNIYEAFLQLPDAEPDVEMTDDGTLIWAFLLD